MNEPNHGRSTSDTVRFRDVELVGGIPAATLKMDQVDLQLLK